MNILRFKRIMRTKLPPKQAWLAVLVANIIHISCMPVEAYIASKIPGINIVPMIVSTILGVAFLNILLVVRKKPPFWLLSLIYIVSAASIEFCFFSTNPLYALNSDSWVPFQGAKLGCLISAIIAPSFLSGAIGIAIYAGASTIQFLSFPPDLQNRIADGEPAIVLVFGLSALLMLVFRFRQEAINQKLQEAIIQGSVMRHLARKILSIRDLMNTPLQTLELATSMLKNSSQQDMDTLDTLKRSVESLKTLSANLKAYESQVDWTKAETSFDAKSVISNFPNE